MHECTLLNANKKCSAHRSRNINHIINSKQKKYEVRRILINSKLHLNGIHITFIQCSVDFSIKRTTGWLMVYTECARHKET